MYSLYIIIKDYIKNKIFNIKFKEENFYNIHKDFIIAVTNYIKYQKFKIRLEKVKKNAIRNIYKKIILYSKEDNFIKISNTINIKN